MRRAASGPIMRGSARRVRGGAARRRKHKGDRVSVNLTVITSAQLTEMQERFSYGLSCGLGPTQSAAVVGYANPSVAGARMVGDPRIRAVVKALRNRRIDKLASLSLRENC